MTWIKKPFHRNYRPQKPWQDSWYNDRVYIVDREYAQSPEHYIRAFDILENDLQEIFEFIEPSDESKEVFSYKIHGLFMRVCIEVEANFKSIFKENIYTKKIEKNWNITDYSKINITHRLSSYKVSLPIWNWSNWTFSPFEQWGEWTKLDRYSAYNSSKHNRQSAFKQANFNNLMNAFSALLIILSAQFRTEDFSHRNALLAINTDNYYEWMDWISGIWQLFRIIFPDDRKDEEMYEFNWKDIKEQWDKFQKINYDNI